MTDSPKTRSKSPSAFRRFRRRVRLERDAIVLVSLSTALLALLIGSGGMLALFKYWQDRPKMEQVEVRTSLLVEIESAHERGDVEKVLRLRLRLEENETAWRAQLRLRSDGLNAIGDFSLPVDDATRAHLRRLLNESEPLLTVSYDDHLVRAGSFLLIGDHDAAAREAMKAITIDPERAEARSILGTALLRLRRYGEALAQFDEILSERPTEVPALIGRAGALSSFHRYREALEVCDFAMSHASDNARLLVVRSHVLGGLYRMSEALDAANRAAELRPGSHEAHTNRGVYLRGLGRIDEALLALDKALELKPEFAEAHMGKAVVLLMKGELDEALEEMEKAMTFRPEWIEPLQVKVMVLAAQGNLEGALEVGKRAVVERPLDPAAFMILGLAMFAAERYDDAVADFEKAVALGPWMVEAESNRIFAMFKAGHLEEAQRASMVAVGRWPQFVLLRYNYALILVSAGLHDEGFSELQRVFEEGPSLKDIARADPDWDLVRAESVLGARFEEVLKK